METFLKVIGIILCIIALPLICIGAIMLIMALGLGSGLVAAIMLVLLPGVIIGVIIGIAAKKKEAN